MRYLSLFSGIEAATMAWSSLGWSAVAFSEIEPFPCAVLAHHYPDIPNLGDVTKITAEQIKSLGQIDLIVFGSPCQDLSISGKRTGFKDANGNNTRSGLFTTAIRLIRWAREHNGCRFALWENVPGAFSSNKGADFAQVVGLLAGLDNVAIPKNGWGTEGAAVGDDGMLEWAVLDAQWFGLAQRRKRVFAFADFGDWSSRPPILLERHSLRGDSPPSREAGQDVAGTLASRTNGGGFPGSDEAMNGYVQPVSIADRSIAYVEEGGQPLRTSASGTNQAPTAVVCFGGNNTSGPIDISPALNAHGGSVGRLDFESECFAVQHAQIGRKDTAGPQGKGWQKDVSFTLDSRACADVVTYGIPGNWIGRSPENGGNAVEPMVNIATCLTKTDVHGVAIAFPERLSGTQCVKAEDLSPSLGALNPMAVSFRACGQDGFMPDVIAPPICSSTGGGSGVPTIQSGMVVRRLTPVECERLMGFPDNFTLIPVRGKQAADGPRYKALGNSMAVPVILYIGKTINSAISKHGHQVDLTDHANIRVSR